MSVFDFYACLLVCVIVNFDVYRFRSVTIAKSKATNQTQCSFNSRLVLALFLEHFTRCCICTMFNQILQRNITMCKLCALHVRYLHALRFDCIGNVISEMMYKHVVLKNFRINLG